MGNALIEIRLLGDLSVRRADGSLVQPHEWRTGKAADLLRLLALEAGKPVRISTLLDRLWPDVDESRGRASLRTAASAVRRALGSDCVERQLDGVALRGAWVDVEELRAAAVEGRAAMRAGDHARVLEQARVAQALHRGEFRAHNDDSEWADRVRSCLGRLRHELLAEGADAAAAVGAFDEAVDFATRLVEADPTSERAHRALIRGYAGLGEFDEALRVFERCRRMLATELGVDPSPRTLQLHAELLAAGAAASVRAPLAVVAPHRPAGRRTRGSRRATPPQEVLHEQVRQFLRGRYPGLDFEVNVAFAQGAGLAG
jgi:pentatricopeptide repeat protein